MKKIISIIALAAITLGSVYAAPVQQQTDSTKTDTTKMKKKSGKMKKKMKDSTKMKKDSI